MAGGIFYYTIAGRQISNNQLSFATVMAYLGIGLLISTREKKFVPIETQLLNLDQNERDFVKEYMEKHRQLPSSSSNHHH